MKNSTNMLVVAAVIVAAYFGVIAALSNTDAKTPTAVIIALAFAGVAIYKLATAKRTAGITDEASYPVTLAGTAHVAPAGNVSILAAQPESKFTCDVCEDTGKVERKLTFIKKGESDSYTVTIPCTCCCEKAGR